jgi:hypothetical protein
MQILVMAKRREGVDVETMRPHFMAEVQAVWELYTQGICRAFYSRADQPGPAILMIESDSVESAKSTLASLPLVERNMIDLDYIPLAPFLNLNQLFEAAN